jgi:hypothetical protein
MDKLVVINNMYFFIVAYKKEKRDLEKNWRLVDV